MCGLLLFWEILQIVLYPPCAILIRFISNFWCFPFVFIHVYMHCYIYTRVCAHLFVYENSEYIFTRLYIYITPLSLSHTDKEAYRASSQNDGCQEIFFYRWTTQLDLWHIQSFAWSTSRGISNSSLFIYVVYIHFS